MKQLLKNKKGVLGVGIPIGLILVGGSLTVLAVTGGLAAFVLGLKHTLYAGALGIGARVALPKVTKGLSRKTKRKK